MNKTDFKKIYIPLLVLIILAALYLVSLIFGNFISSLWDAVWYILCPLIISIVICYLITPIKDKFDKIFKYKKPALSATLAIVIFVLLAIVFIFGISLLLKQEIMNSVLPLIKNNWEQIKNTFLKFFPDWSEKISQIKDQITNTSMVASIAGIIKKVTGSAVKWGIYCCMIPFYMFYILYDKNIIFNGIEKLFPAKLREHANKCLIKIDTVIVGYFRGRLASMLFVGIMFTIFLSIYFSILVFCNAANGLNIGMAFLFAVIFGIIFCIMDIVPYLGPLVATILVMLFSAGLANIWYMMLIYAAISLVINFIIQWLENYIVIPKLMEKEVELNPLIVFMSILFFTKFLGASGAIIAIPIVGAIKAIILYIQEIQIPGEEKEEEKPEKTNYTIVKLFKKWKNKGEKKK